MHLLSQGKCIALTDPTWDKFYKILADNAEVEKAILRRDWLATSILLNNIQHVSTITNEGLPDPISLSQFQVVHKIPDEELK